MFLSCEERLVFIYAANLSFSYIRTAKLIKIKKDDCITIDKRA